jgi:Bacterial Ig-like domain (group 1)
LVSSLTLLWASPVGATTPTEGSSVPGSAVPVDAFNAGIPFSSDQQINVVVPANSLFIHTSPVNIVECAAANGVLPTLPQECDGNTIQGPTILPGPDGSINLESQRYGLYQVFALPDTMILGENASDAVTCGNTAATECVLYIGENQGDFTQPHVFSQPFYVNDSATDSGSPAGDGSRPPEVVTTSATFSTVVATPATAIANGTDSSTVAVILVGTGGAPVAGDAILLTGVGQSTISPARAVVTDDEGMATFSVTDATAETVTYTAVDTTADVTLSARPTVDFTVPPPPQTHGSAVPVGPQSSRSNGFTGWNPGLPFASGQTINIVVPANSVLAVDTDLQFVECAAPNGVIPTQSNACDPKTLLGITVKPNSDGSINAISETAGEGYPVYSLPDLSTLGEGLGGPKCGDTVATECIIYVGDDYTDLTQPHVWSQPFFVSSDLDDSDSGVPGGDGSLGGPPTSTPEAASIVALPVIAVVFFGIGAWAQVNRRRRREGASAQ